MTSFVPYSNSVREILCPFSLCGHWGSEGQQAAQVHDISKWKNLSPHFFSSQFHSQSLLPSSRAGSTDGWSLIPRWGLDMGHVSALSHKSMPCLLRGSSESKNSDIELIITASLNIFKLESLHLDLFPLSQKAIFLWVPHCGVFLLHWASSQWKLQDKLFPVGCFSDLLWTRPGCSGLLFLVGSSAAQKTLTGGRSRNKRVVRGKASVWWHGPPSP